MKSRDSSTDRSSLARVAPWCGALLTAAFAVAVNATEIRRAVNILEYTVRADEPHAERLIASSQHLRFDDGERSQGFILYDASTDRAYSISHELESVTIVRSQAPLDVESPIPLTLTTTTVPDATAPAVGGVTPLHVRLDVNGQHCMDLVALPGLMTDVVRLWGQFRSLLAREHKRVLHSIPFDQHNACDLALNVFNPGWMLEFGLPIRVVSQYVRPRALARFSSSGDIDVGLFDVPPSYHWQTVGTTQ